MRQSPRSLPTLISSRAGCPQTELRHTSHRYHVVVVSEASRLLATKACRDGGGHDHCGTGWMETRRPGGDPGAGYWRGGGLRSHTSGTTGNWKGSGYDWGYPHRRRRDDEDHSDLNDRKTSSHGDGRAIAICIHHGPPDEWRDWRVDVRSGKVFRRRAGARRLMHGERQ